MALPGFLACAVPASESSDHAVIGGQPSGADAVVMLDLGAGPCSGVVVAPRVVLTAAHCLGVGGQVQVGASAPWRQTLEVVAQHAHRAYVPGELADDLALVRLAAPAEVAPLAVRATDAAALAEVQVIGFGRQVADQPASGGVRHGGLVAVVGHDAGLLYTAATGPVFTCAGDSGGPALDPVGAIAALVVAGDAGCAGASRLARVDRAGAWIATVIAAWDGPCAADGACATGCATVDPDCDPCGLEGTCAPGCAAPDLDCPLGGAPGATCADDGACESRLCAPAPDDATSQFCSQPCGPEAPCPAPISACVDGGCVYPGPTPGRLGSACVDDAACRSGRCDRGLDVCAVACGGDDACPDGYACATTGSGPLCRPSSGGCGAGPDGGLGALALVGIALALSGRRASGAGGRRRRSPPAPPRRRG